MTLHFLLLKKKITAGEQVPPRDDLDSAYATNFGMSFRSMSPAG